MADVVRLRLLQHALPREAWAAYWQQSSRKQRSMIRYIVEDAPSLMHLLPAMMEGAFTTGRLRAEEELAYAFPDQQFDDVFASMPLLEVEDFLM